MRPRLSATFLAGALFVVAGQAAAQTTVLEVDGLWSKGIEKRQNGKLEECWASRTLPDGTVLTLAQRSAEAWYLRLSNEDWQLLQARKYAASALIDFYPPIRVTVTNSSRTAFEIPGLDQDGELIGQIYFGHSIKLTFDGTTTAFDLEGSAKAIEWVRGCAEQVK